MSVKDYPITFGYLATTTLNGQPYTHRGTDRKCPTGTPIVIGSVTIGKTGNTGLSNGPHLHLQAGTDKECQNTVNPEPYAFKGGTVVALRTADVNAWGKFITLKIGYRKYITYAHLSEVNVEIGQVIKEAIMPTEQDVKDYFRVWEKRQPTTTELKDYTSKTWRYLTDKILAAQKARAVQLIRIKDTEIARLKANTALSEDGFWAYIKTKLGLVKE